jgi:hypothetical protein
VRHPRPRILIRACKETWARTVTIGQPHLSCNNQSGYALFQFDPCRDQMTGSRKTLICLMLVLASGVPAGAGALDELYTSQAIVTGTGEKNRQLGFRDCLERVLLRVSGDQRLVARPEMTLRSRGLQDRRVAASSSASACGLSWTPSSARPITDPQTGQACSVAPAR